MLLGTTNRIHQFDSDPEDEEEPSTKRARLENLSANQIWDPEAIKSIDRIIFYDSIYIPLERAEDSEEDLVQLEHVRTVFNFEGGLRTNHLIIPGQMKFQDIPDILFCRKISDLLCNNVGKIILPIKKLKLVIFKERIEIHLSDSEEKGYLMKIIYKGEEGKGKRICGEALHREMDDYKTLAACDFFFLLKSPELKLEKLGFKIKKDESMDRYPDVSVLDIIVNFLAALEDLLENFKPSYLDEIKIRVWNDEKVLSSANFEPIKNISFGGCYETEQWKNAIDLDIRDDLIPKDWDNFAHFEEIKVKSVDQNDLRKMLENRPTNADEQYIVTVSEPLKIEDMTEAFKDSGTFDKDPESPDFQFPLELTKTGYEFIIFRIDINEVKMSDDSPVTKKNYEPFIKKRFEERVSLELTHTYLCRAIQKNQRNPGEKITALTPLNAIQDDVEDSEAVTSSSSPDVNMEPSSKRSRASDNPENEKFDSIKSKDPISCDPKAYDPPGPRSNIDSDPVQFETVRDVFEEQAELLTNRFEDSVKLQDIPDILFSRRISKELSERMEEIEIPIARLTVSIFTDFVIVDIYDEDEEVERKPIVIRYQKTEERSITCNDYKSVAACGIFFVLQHPDLKLQILTFYICEGGDRYVDVSLQKLILKLLERLEHKVHVEKFIYTYSREELYVPNTVTNYLPQLLRAFQPGTLKKIDLALWNDKEVLGRGMYERIRELNFEEVFNTRQWKEATQLDDLDGLVPKDWDNFIHLKTINMKSVDQNDLKYFLNYIPKYADSIFEVTYEKLKDIAVVKASFRGHGKFDADPDSTEFDFPLKFYRDVEDERRFLVYKLDNDRFEIYFQNEKPNCELWN
ncbi:Protein CBG21584 [Caenorhabditis briggsae]|uniref:Protein CBG21584 n=1 Tax=Caenorhabditis briggsae TaxID=6238 RepID=A8Y0F6_CAEBR|nr:Protein CBG21584 [Caenorhabditis briggsae]CAP38341.2 Protein CBG21584 [Caenorhabditis briggsae]